MREQGSAGADHQRYQQQGVTYAAVGGETGEDIAEYPGHAIKQQQRANGRPIEAGALFEEGRDIGVRGKVRQADQQHGNQANPRLWVDEQGRQVADANGLVRVEPR
ncbi:hypothetical protein D3C79_783130 [compost metagenome]